MNSKEKNTLQMFRGAQGWFGAHPGLTAVPLTGDKPDEAIVPPIAQQIGEFDEVVVRFSAHAARQQAAARAAKGATEAARQRRSDLIENHMQHLADIAKAALPDVVQMNAAFRMSTVPRDTEGLLASGEAMAKLGEQYEATLIARGLAPTFVADLRAAIAALKAAIDERRQHKANRRGSAEGITAAIVDGRRLILSLSALIKMQLRGDSVALAEWKQIKRVTLTGSRVSNAPTPAGGVVRATDRAAPATDRAVPVSDGAVPVADRAGSTANRATPEANAVPSETNRVPSETERATSETPSQQPKAA